MNCRTPERNYFYLSNPETCRILELDGEGSGGYGSGSHPAPGAGLGLSPECWVSWSSSHCTDTHSPEHVGYAAGQGRRSERTGLCLLFVPALFCCSFCQAVSPPSVSPCRCHWVGVFHCATDFLLKGNHTTKTFSFSCWKQSCLAIFILWSLFLKLSLAAAALRIPVIAEVEAEQFGLSQSWASVRAGSREQELCLPEHTGTRCLLSPVKPFPLHTQWPNSSYSMFWCGLIAVNADYPPPCTLGICSIKDQTFQQTLVWSAQFLSLFVL